MFTSISPYSAEGSLVISPSMGFGGMSRAHVPQCPPNVPRGHVPPSPSLPKGGDRDKQVARRASPAGDGGHELGGAS